MFIEQALFGYSNGHHLLSSSLDIPSKVLNILEPLSDFSGTDYQEGFHEYYSGYFFQEINQLALSKTWYASEMSRPGCVWTHTLFIRIEDLSKMQDVEQFDEMFSRPNTIGSYEKYKDSIDIIEPSWHRPVMVNQELAIGIVSSSFEQNRPIIIGANSAMEYASTFIALWLALGSSILRNESFCTGSLTNRTANKKSLDYQVVPINRIKNIVRTTPHGVMLELTLKDAPEWINIVLDNYVYMTSDVLYSFTKTISKCSSQKYMILSFAQILSILSRNIQIDLLEIKDSISSELPLSDQISIINRLIIEILEGSNGLLRKDFQLILILEQLSTKNSRLPELIDHDMVLGKLNAVFEKTELLPVELFKFLLEFEINDFGEKVIVCLADFALRTNLQRVTGDDLKGCNVLIGIKSELALNPEIWKAKSIDQIEVIEALRNSNAIYSEEFVRKFSAIIFQNGSKSITQALFDVFGDVIVKCYLEWAQKEADIVKIEQWIVLCRYDIEYCINFLPQNSIMYLDQAICEMIDPYSNSALSIPCEYWSEYYVKYIQNSEDDNKIRFACFILPIILRSNIMYPESLAFFAFNCVYILLSKDLFDYKEWNKLSKLLPEIAWNNNWDKCKRLRRAAKRAGYRFELNWAGGRGNALPIHLID